MQTLYIDIKGNVQQTPDKTTVGSFRLRDKLNGIQPIVCELGRHWEQPSRESIHVTDKIAVMTYEDFCNLKEYSTSIPTGAYEGKMWKALVYIENKEVWLLRWYYCDYLVDTNMLKTRQRVIHIIPKSFVKDCDGNWLTKRVDMLQHFESLTELILTYYKIVYAELPYNG